MTDKSKAAQNNTSVKDYIASLNDEQTIKDSHVLVEMMQRISGHEPTLWNAGTLGFDTYHYNYDSGREGDICMIGFSPRSQALTMYIDPGFPADEPLMKKRGKYTKGHSCLYIKKLEDVDMHVLKQLVTESYRSMKKKHKS